MNIFILDCLSMTSIEAVHEYIARVLRLPSYYGANLDALYDCLGEFSMDSTIIIINSECLTGQLGEYGEALLQTFRDAAAEDGAFILKLH